MGFWELLVLAAGLSMDAFAVSVCKGLSVPELKPKHALITGLYFGGFQALMPLLGYLLGRQFEALITNIDHWIAFILLGIIGGKMLIDGIKAEDDEETGEFKLDLKELFLLAIATSIDALSVGFTTAGYGLVMAVVCSLIVAVVTFVICETGLCLGKTLGTKLSGKADVLGGVILIGIGIVSWGRGM